MNWLMVAAGGMAGSLVRYGFIVLFADITRKSVFPWAIMSINIAGSLLAGVAFALAHDKQWLTVPQQHLLSVGFLGGFTTYSAFSVDCVRLIQAGEWLQAGSYALFTTVLCLAATAVGVTLVRMT